MATATECVHVVYFQEGVHAGLTEPCNHVVLLLRPELCIWSPTTNKPCDAYVPGCS